MADKPMTVSVLADRWGVSTTHVYNLLQSGEIEGFKLGKKLWRIQPEAVARYEQRQAEPEASTTDDPPEPDRPDTRTVGRSVRRGF
ncbi:MAG TPA: helix-turn-helix domain-containing protein [Rhizorhapis sp.]|nr:helix-turn-helix domain-containing protein [Rhizorhapis sp.]